MLRATIDHSMIVTKMQLVLDTLVPISKLIMHSTCKRGFLTHFDAKVLRSGFQIVPTMEVLFG